MVSAKLLADRHRRQREAREDAADSLERRTTYLTDHTGRTVHVIDWSREQIAAWRAEDRAVATRKKIAASWERCPVCTTQCSQNECAAGCSIVVPDPQSKVTVTEDYSTTGKELGVVFLAAFVVFLLGLGAVAFIILMA